MNIAIYQINTSRDNNNAAFLSLEGLEHIHGSNKIDSEIYDRVFEGDVDCNDLEDVYRMFNVNKPDGYRGRSLSVSDVVEIIKGDIEAYYPFCEEVCIVCNDEGKFNGNAPNRAVYGEDKQMLDIIFGTFFICDCKGENFGSLNKEQQERYKKQFENPEHFFRVGGEIKAVPYKPMQDRER